MSDMSDGFGDLFYFEDHLPPGQDPIDTSSMTTARVFLGFLMQSRARTGYSAMGVITGRSGIGKTIAVHTYLDKFLPRPHTGRPACTRVKVQHRSSALALARTLLGVLGDRPYGHNVYEVTDEAALAILRNDLELVVIDEADRLTADSFEVLRHIYDRTGCPIVLVGLPQILDVITRQEKFAGRVTMHLRFPPLAEREVVEMVLPNLVLPHWHFDATDGTDRALGALLWRRCAPSLRRLRDVLQVASEMADMNEEPRVSRATIEAAFEWLPHSPRHQPLEHDGAHEREADDAGGVDAQEAQD
jgi:AAA domain